MAQLIKLENYVSRYELDIYRYPGQFIRIKKQRWEKLHSRREREEALGDPLSHSESEESLKALKREFTEDVFFYQLRWASSTLKEKSFLDPKYRFDSWLKFFLLRFPDNYLVLYRPVFRVRQAPVELDIIMISPMAVWCVTLLQGDDGIVFQGESSRFWRKIE
ncbi:MAG TPA: NERD domain-containing protein, partial [Bacillales bacterium]|nr:NERD domain-containing protein [Bacillales bacterium]